MAPRNNAEIEHGSDENLAAHPSPLAEKQAANPRIIVNYSKMQLQWINVGFFSVTTLLAIYGAFFVTFRRETLLCMSILYAATMLGITAGYHRLWSHRAYEATAPLRSFLALAGAGAFQGSILWWCRHHRVHHRWTDTDRDPYSAQKGLFWSHIGWLLFTKQETSSRVHIYSHDLEQDPVVAWQHRNYVWLAPTISLALPTLLAGLGWGDWQGGFFHAAILRMTLTHHATFCVNSLAHYLGEANYDDERTPRDHIVTAVITFGEGYHNFHHEFPRDYRNAIRWWQFDPTKWFIWSCSRVGLVHGLRRFPENELHKARVLMATKRLEEEKRRINWGQPVHELPHITWDECRRRNHYR
ncbi:fatty acid desaturase-domain-containing protein [Thamnocephalis sphaerospora]|uniref:Fatty acid desaturase-domain-containing protein n=1 Tax=Thamnocephalis sphaerospora TaxID=78915 RepID=A0A4P9XHX8_9FUNG|nr:fatty acid desaturase-domain-containing protein [Thamnocephalis sphaerospora]|eukprot:RKP05313.1 fatty acid desaturase-domain-containing protein [Thamnocephalis sphaerospora]